MTYPLLYILRHGETEWNAQHRLQGHYDSALTRRGLEQARQQHAILSTCDLKEVSAYCSPQGRAFHTASIALAGHCSVIETDPRLSEIGLGAWAGLHRRELPPVSDTSGDAFDLYQRAPGGEGFAALRARCAAFLDTLRDPAVLVTHGITSRMLRLIILGLDINEIADLPGGQGVVYRLENGRQIKLTNGA